MTLYKYHFCSWKHYAKSRYIRIHRTYLVYFTVFNDIRHQLQERSHSMSMIFHGYPNKHNTYLLFLLCFTFFTFFTVCSMSFWRFRGKVMLPNALPNQTAQCLLIRFCYVDTVGGCRQGLNFSPMRETESSLRGLSKLSPLEHLCPPVVHHYVSLWICRPCRYGIR